MMYNVKGISNEYLNILYAADLFAVHSGKNAYRGINRRKDKPMEIIYTRVGDYLIPNMTLREKPPPDGFGEPVYD